MWLTRSKPAAANSERHAAVHLSVKEKLLSLGETVDEDRWMPLRRLAHLLALKVSPDGQVHLGHWWRGPLLYSLVSQYRPCQILEIGTGRGFGAACMAQALLDAGIAGMIWTIDQIPPSELQPWVMDEGAGPTSRRLSLAQVWNTHLAPAVRARIHGLTGDSRHVLKQWRRDGLPSIDFCFIDGGHDYRTVKRDFLATLKIADPCCRILFDDYTPRRGYGVHRLVDEEVLPKVPPQAVEIIDMLSRDRTVYGEDVAHQMALVWKR